MGNSHPCVLSSGMDSDVQGAAELTTGIHSPLSPELLAQIMLFFRRMCSEEMSSVADQVLNLSPV